MNYSWGDHRESPSLWTDPMAQNDATLWSKCFQTSKFYWPLKDVTNIRNKPTGTAPCRGQHFSEGQKPKHKTGDISE